MNYLKRILLFIQQVHFKYLFSKTFVRADKTAVVKIHNSVKIKNSRITVSKNATLIIGEGCSFTNVHMHISGTVIMGKKNIITQDSDKILPFYINDRGSFILGDYNRLKCKIMVRFDGRLTIGNRNNINDETEIRADEEVVIGNYNQISYKCIIWDTNTHNIYSDEYRRELTDKYYPVFGYEYEKPVTKPVYIGSDCWIGREVSILKGVVISNSCILGYKATVSNTTIHERNIVVPKIDNVILTRKE